MSRKGSVLKYGAGTPMVSSGIKVEDHDADFSLDSDDNQSSSSSSSSSALGGSTSVSFDAKTTQINEEETLKKQSMVLRIYHIDDPSHDVDHHNINLPQFISFKTLLVNGLSTGLDVIKVTLSKLLLPGDPASLAKHNFHLFIVQEDSKRKVEEHERLLPILEKFTKGGHECKIIFLRSSTADYVSAVGASLFSTTVFSNASTLSKIRVEYGPIEGEKIKHRTLLNDQQYSHFSNLTFITADGQRVFSHRAIIQSRCPSLVAGPYVKKCKEKKSSVVQGQKMLVVEYGDNTFMNRFVLMQVLDFVYSAQLDFEELSITETQLIMYVAGQLTIPRLEWLCFRQLQIQINTQNVFLMLRQADQLKIESLKQFCTNYAHENWSDFSLNKSGLEIIGLDLFQDLTISKAQKAVSSSSGASPSGTTLVSPRSRSESVGGGGVPKDSIIDDFHTVYLGMAFADGKAVCKDSEEPVIFHKAILAAHSTPFFTMIDQYTKEKQPHLQIKNLERAEFQQLLQFVYTGTCDLTVRPALHLIEFAIYEFQMPELRDVCEKLACLKISLDVVLDLLYMTYLGHCEGRPLLMKLRQTCLEYICDNFGLVDVARLRSLRPASMAYDLLELLHQREAGSKQKNRKSVSHTRKTFSFVD